MWMITGDRSFEAQRGALPPGLLLKNYRREHGSEKLNNIMGHQLLDAVILKIWDTLFAIKHTDGHGIVYKMAFWIYLANICDKHFLCCFAFFVFDKSIVVGRVTGHGNNNVTIWGGMALKVACLQTNNPPAQDKVFKKPKSSRTRTFVCKGLLTSALLVHSFDNQWPNNVFLALILRPSQSAPLSSNVGWGHEWEPGLMASWGDPHLM